MPNRKYRARSYRTASFTTLVRCEDCAACIERQDQALHNSHHDKIARLERAISERDQPSLIEPPF